MAATVPESGRAERVDPSIRPEADATHDLFSRFRGQIYGYCLHQLGSREEAEDAMQTTFMNAFRGLKRGIVPRVEGAWLFKIAQNVCLSRRRSVRRRGRIETPINFEVLQDVVPARERTGDDLIRLHDVLEAMPPMQRRAILMREWRGLSYREIAAELRVSQAAVEALIFRGRRTLAAGLADDARETARRRHTRYGVDASGLVAALKTIFGGGTTVKIAVTIAAVATTTIVSADESHRQRPLVHGVSPRAVVPAADVVRVTPSRPSVHRPVARAAVRSRRHAIVARSRFVDSTATAATPSPPRVFARESDESVPHVDSAPALAIASPPQGQAPPVPAPDPQLPSAPSAPPSTSPGRAHVSQDETAGPPVAPPAEQSADAAQTAVSQANEEHGTATAPGQQNKADNTDKSKKNGG